LSWGIHQRVNSKLLPYLILSPQSVISNSGDTVIFNIGFSKFRASYFKPKDNNISGFTALLDDT
jgi:hypothetical protein